MQRVPIYVTNLFIPNLYPQNINILVILLNNLPLLDRLTKLDKKLRRPLNHKPTRCDHNTGVI